MHEIESVYLCVWILSHNHSSRKSLFVCFMKYNIYICYEIQKFKKKIN